MKNINITSYTGSKHISLVADQKNNEDLTTTFQATAGTVEEAQANIKEQLENELLEEVTLSINEFTRFPKMGTEQLLRLYEKTSEMLGAHEKIEEILLKRNAISLPEETEEPEEETPVREYKKCMTEECLQARLAEARTNYKKFCKFLCTKDKEEHYGIIRSARLDKRSGFIQYRIEILEKLTEDDTIYTQRSGRIFGKGDDSKDLTIFEETPAEIQLSDPKVKENTESVNDTTENA